MLFLNLSGTSEVNSLDGSIAVFPPDPGESSAGRAER